MNKEREEWAYAAWMREAWHDQRGLWVNRLFVVLASLILSGVLWGCSLILAYWLVPGPWKMGDEQRLDIRFRREFYQCRKAHGSWNYGYNGDTRVWWCGDAPRPGVF